MPSVTIYSAADDLIDLLRVPDPIIDSMEAWNAYNTIGGNTKIGFASAVFVAKLDIDHHDNGRSRFTNCFTTGAMYSHEKYDADAIAKDGRDGNFISDHLTKLTVKVRLQHTGAMEAAYEQVMRLLDMCPKLKRVDIVVVSEWRELAKLFAEDLKLGVGIMQLESMINVVAMVGRSPRRDAEAYPPLSGTRLVVVGAVD